MTAHGYTHIGRGVWVLVAPKAPVPEAPTVPDVAEAAEPDKKERHAETHSTP
jgi:hypothetical protein